MQNSASKLPAPLLDGIIGIMPVVIVCVDELQRIILFNSAAERIFRHKMSDVWGKNFGILLAPDCRQQNIDLLGKLIKEESFFTHGIKGDDILGIRANGEPFPANITLSKFNDSGTTTVVALFSDLSADNACESLLKRLGTAVEQSANTVVFTDPEGIIEYVNPRFTELTGYTLDEVQGKTPRILRSGTTTLETYEDLWRTIKHGNEWRGELRNKRKNGEFYWESITVSPMLDRAGTITHFLAIEEDITQRKEMEARIASTMTQLSRANEELTQFTSMVSHDLQAPLSVIVNSLELVLSEEGALLEEQTKKLLATGHRSGCRMQQLISDLLSYSRAGNTEVPFHMISLLEVLAIAQENLRDVILRTKASVTVEDLPQVFGNKNLLIELFQNLLSNALKYCDKETPIINVGSVEKHSGFFITVRDNGIGIPSAGLDAIFSPFTRLHSSSRYPGSGIGLATCKKIVDIHHGKIWATSVEKKGSEICIELPLIPDNEEILNRTDIDHNGPLL